MSTSSTQLLEKPYPTAAGGAEARRPAAGGQPAGSPAGHDRCPQCWEPVHERFCDKCGKEQIRRTRDSALERVGPALDRGD